MVHVYDYVRADGDLELQRILDRINALGYTLISVYQHAHTYTIFFRRCADGK